MEIPDIKPIPNAEQPAYPSNEGWHTCGGLTKREYFAGLAMTAMLGDAEVSRWVQTDPRYNRNNFKEVVAANAVEFSDALLKELDKI